nr:non capsid protein NS 1 [Hymenolepis microstoma]
MNELTCYQPVRGDQENRVPNNEVPHKYYYTVVLRKYSKVPTSISCLYVEHDDHMHVLLHAKTNVSRKVNRLLNDCLIPPDDWRAMKSTRQLVRNVYRIIQQFKHQVLGIVCQRGEQKAFHFENLLNRTVALIEEPLITIETKNDYKCLLGGERLEVDIKCGARRFLQRVPVIVTTNEDLGSQLTSMDKAALYSRV